MPEASALISALILERPMCLECITMRSPVTGAQDAQRHLDIVARALHLHRDRDGRCRACGVVGPVFWIERPPL
ncbi:MAG: hypothetical protein ACREKH_20485 [Candidatus Rokuibacteriota bacterium]